MKIQVDRNQKGKPVVPYWRVCVGGGRVAEALRADFQKHLEMVQNEMPFSYIRMHGLFHEDMMVYREDQGRPILNWQYVDLVYDHWLSVGIRPFAELGFMPYDMASGDETVFWWKGNITPPADWKKWELLVYSFIRHVVDRYGLAEVRKWYFEVWNEPNLDAFWKNADFDAYMELYERTARVIKRIDERLRVGGPASSGCADKPGRPPWGKAFLQACAQRGLPVDFFSTHPYPTLHPVDLEGHGYMIFAGPDRLRRDLEGIRGTVSNSAYPDAQVHLTEWNSSPSPRDKAHDTAFMCPFVIRNNWLGRGYADSLAFWTVSDIFEEGRIGDTPLHGGFGLVNIQGLRKPAYHGYWFLSKLGDEELAGGDNFAVTRHPNGRIAALFWNYCHYSEKGKDSRSSVGDVYERFEPGGTESHELILTGSAGPVRARITTFDRDHGSVYDAWVDLGKPAVLSREQVAELKGKCELTAQVSQHVPDAGEIRISVSVEPHGAVLVEVT
jgi:xylan 1,4-beta-xylosidase